MKTQNCIFIGIIFLAFALSYSCEKEKITFPPIVIDSSKTYSFSNDVYPMFNRLNNCTGCHGNSGYLDFTKSPSEIVSQLYANAPDGFGIRVDTANPENSKFYLLIKNKVSSVNHTPHPYSFTQDDLTNTLIWITQGAKNN